MAVPAKHRHMGGFWQYYSGAKRAPVPTVFIGGNHEAPNHLWELYYGGYAAPDIYYLGHAGVVNFGGLRIGGMSGIYKAHDYRKGHFERPPYSPSAMRSAYHVRELEVFRLAQLHRPLDVFLSHDWPAGVTEYGDKRALYRAKPYFRDEAERGELGSPPAMDLLRTLRPRYWFSAHLHCKFPALVPHGDGATTRFLALDKCLPGRHFLQVLSVPVAAPAPGPPSLAYDSEWLAVLRSTHHLLSASPRQPPLPAFGAGRAPPPAADVAFVEARLREAGARVAPFCATAEAHDPAASGRRAEQPTSIPVNAQTVHVLSLIGREYNLGGGGGGGGGGAGWAGPGEDNPEEIDLGDMEAVGVDDLGPPPANDEEIPLED